MKSPVRYIPPIFILVLALLMAFPAAVRAQISVQSPGGLVEAEIFAGEGGRLSYRVNYRGRPAVETSPLGIVADGVDLGAGTMMEAPYYELMNETWTTRGKHSRAVNHCVTGVLPISRGGSGVALSLEIRVFDDGFAYRYLVPGEGTRRVGGEASSWRLPEDSTVWFQTNTANYEGEYVKKPASAIGADVRIGPPLTVRLPDDGGWAFISEAALFDSSGMTLKSKGNGVFEAEFLDDPDGWTAEGPIRTPWRVVVLAPDLNGLFNSDLIDNLVEPVPETPAWVRPGRSLWSWLNGGQEGVNPANMRHYADAASELGWEYVLVDDGWEDNPPSWKPRKGWSEPGKGNFSVMKDLVDYARSKGVGIWVWKHYELIQETAERRDYFKQLHEIGVVGVKIDFMDSEAKRMIRFYEDCLKDALDFQLMVDFHGANKPTGEWRKYPNEMTREGVRGLEYRMVFGEHNTTLPFTRALAGHLDYTPMHFNQLWIANTTLAHQLASGVILSSPVTFFGGNPDDYLKSPVIDVLKALPTTWDETIVLKESEIGRLAAFARRSGDVWFVAVMNGGGAKKMKLKLDFLADGEYELIAGRDDPKRAFDLERKTGKATRETELPVQMRAGGGFMAMLRPLADR